MQIKICVNKHLLLKTESELECDWFRNYWLYKIRNSKLLSKWIIYAKHVCDCQKRLKIKNYIFLHKLLDWAKKL